MAYRNTFSALVGLAVPMIAIPAAAQSTPDIEGAVIQQGQITDLLRDEIGQGRAMPGDDGEIEGEAGVYVLTLNEIFFVGGSAGLGYAENPERSALSDGGSFLTSAGLTAGLQTRVAEQFDVGLRASVSGVEYLEAAAPSSRSISAALSAGMPLGDSPFYAGISAFGGYNFDGDFKGGTSFYGASASLGAGLPLGPATLLRPGIGVTRQWSGISENNSTSAAVSVSLLHQPAPQVTLAADAQVSRAWFDNFYEDVTFVERSDWSYSAGLSANWSPAEWFSVSASAGYEKRDSAFFISEYEGFETAIAMTVRHRF